MPEWRHWWRETFTGWFWGIHAFGGEYNIGGVGPLHYVRDNHLEGSIIGGGLTLGHAWRLSRHWRLEAAVGVGYAHTAYDRYENEWCGDLLGREHRNLVGPTKLALNIAWLMGGKKTQPKPVVEPVVAVVTPPAPVTTHRVEFVTRFIHPKAERKVRSLQGSAWLDFRVNQTDIDPAYRRNQAELDSVMASIRVVSDDPNVSIDGVAIHGYASPEGPQAGNQHLAEGRATAFKDYIRQLIRLNDDVFTVSTTAEDWDGLCRQLTERDDIAQRDQILTLIDMERARGTDLDRLEYLIRIRYPQGYQQMKTELYPALRHSDYEVTYTVRSFSVDQAKEIYKTRPDLLGLNELYLIAGQLEEGSPEYNELFATAVRLYPDDATANTNAAVMLLRGAISDYNAGKAVDKQRLATAQHYLEKAGDSPEASLARTVANAFGTLAVQDKKNP